MILPEGIKEFHRIYEQSLYLYFHKTAILKLFRNVNGLFVLYDKFQYNDKFKSDVWRRYNLYESYKFKEVSFLAEREESICNELIVHLVNDCDERPVVFYVFWLLRFRSTFTGFV